MQPIVVTGSHRSGTTWVGKMLALSGEAAYLHEPFNPNRTPGWIAQRLPYWYLYVCEDNEREYEDAVVDLMALRYRPLRNLRRARHPRELARQVGEWWHALRLRGPSRRPLLKDPMALFAAPWLSRRFDAQVVVMVRHPAAFVGSIKKLNWGFDYEVNWLGQDLLMRDLLGGFEDRFRGYVGEVDLVGEGIVMWNAFHHVIDGFRRRHPDWTFVHLEALADDPVGGFRALYDRLGLRWSEAVEQGVAEHASEDNPKDVPAWRRRAVRRDSKAAKTTWTYRLTADEIERVRLETLPVASLFYDTSDWGAARPLGSPSRSGGDEPPNFPPAAKGP